MGHAPGPGLVHHSDAGSQYTSFVFTAQKSSATCHDAASNIPKELT